MALTEIPVELSSTPGIADSSNATAITIDSSEQVGIGVSPAARLHAYSNSAETLRLEGNDEYTYLSFKGTVSSSATSLGLIGYANQSGTAADLNIENTQNGAMTFATNDTIRMTIDANGHVTKPAQPAFQVRKSGNQDNLGVSSTTTITFDTEVFDVGSNFNNASSTPAYAFTAPVTGKYQFNFHLRLENLDTAASFYQLKIVTSNRSYIFTLDPNGFSTDLDYYSVAYSALADMDASDTAYLTIIQSGGTSQTDIHVETYFSGYLVA